MPPKEIILASVYIYCYVCSRHTVHQFLTYTRRNMANDKNYNRKTKIIMLTAKFSRILKRTLLDDSLSIVRNKCTRKYVIIK